MARRVLTIMLASKWTRICRRTQPGRAAQNPPTCRDRARRCGRAEPMPEATVQKMLASLQTPDGGKIVSAREAVRLIRDGDTIATGGFVGVGFAEGIAVALETLYLSQQAAQATDGPRNLT